MFWIVVNLRVFLFFIDEVDVDIIIFFMQEVMIVKGFKYLNIVEFVGVVF